MRVILKMTLIAAACVQLGGCRVAVAAITHGAMRRAEAENDARDNAYYELHGEWPWETEGE